MTQNASKSRNKKRGSADSMTLATPIASFDQSESTKKNVPETVISVEEKVSNDATVGNVEDPSSPMASLHLGNSTRSLDANSVNDSDSEISIFKKPFRANDDDSLDIDELAKSRGHGAAGNDKKFELETCTELIFISFTGERRNIPLTKRITSYSELQREIARYTPKSKAMYVVQDSKGNPIYARSFTSYDVIRIKEIGIQPNRSMLHTLHRDWEKEDYYENKKTEAELRMEAQAAADNSPRSSDDGFGW